MLILDDILLSPVRGFLWIMKELQAAAEQELDSEGDRLTSSLSDLYMMLETGMISEEEFAAKERQVLDRLDALRGEGDAQDEALEAEDDQDISEDQDESDDEEDEEDEEGDQDDEDAAETDEDGGLPQADLLQSGGFEPDASLHPSNEGCEP